MKEERGGSTEWQRSGKKTRERDCRGDGLAVTMREKERARE